MTDTVVEVPVRPSSAPGRYQIGWQLVSADGSPAIGAYAFVLGAAAERRSDGSPRPVLLAAGAGVLGLLEMAVARRRRAGAASTLAG
ncbi:MAG TPA: copper resistance protein CopC [Actinomycetes bacterium]